MSVLLVYVNKDDNILNEYWWDSYPNFTEMQPTTKKFN